MIAPQRRAPDSSCAYSDLIWASIPTGPGRGFRNDVAHIPEDLGACSGVIWATIPEDLGTSSEGDIRRFRPLFETGPEENRSGG